MKDEAKKEEVTPVEAPKEEAVNPQKVTPVEDRSAYNCPTCKGEGLVLSPFDEGDFVRCPQCQGTGKV